MKKKQIALLLILLTAVIIFAAYPTFADEDDILEAGEEVAVDGLIYEIQENNTLILIDYQGEAPANLTISGSIIYNQQTYIVTSIQEHTFSGCDTLTKVMIEENMTSIGEYAFSECESLRHITFPTTLKNIGRGVLSGSDNVEVAIAAGNDALHYEGGLLTQDDRLLYVSPALENVILPNTVHAIDAYAFQDCNNLESITIPNTIGKIEEQAFCKCYGMHSVVIENNPDIIIEDNAFADMEEAGTIYVSTKEMKQHMEANSQSYPEGVSITQIISYDISYNTGGGVFKETCVTKADNTKTVLLPDVEKQGFEFLGWCNDEACEQEPVYQIEEGQSDNVVLYAKWEALEEPELEREEQMQEAETAAVARKSYEIARHEKRKQKDKVKAENKSSINMAAEVDLVTEAQSNYEDMEEQNETTQQQIVKTDGEVSGQTEAAKTTETAEKLVQSDQQPARERNMAEGIAAKLLLILGIVLLLAGGMHEFTRHIIKRKESVTNEKNENKSFQDEDFQ